MCYVLFAVTTALAALIELFLPVVSELRIREPKLQVSEHWIVTLLSLVLFAVILAPIIVLPTLIPSYSDRFKQALMSGLETSG
jgi:hypothetical protein